MNISGQSTAFFVLYYVLILTRLEFRGAAMGLKMKLAVVLVVSTTFTYTLVLAWLRDFLYECSMRCLEEGGIEKSQSLPCLIALAAKLANGTRPAILMHPMVRLWFESILMGLNVAFTVHYLMRLWQKARIAGKRFYRRTLLRFKSLNMKTGRAHVYESMRTGSPLMTVPMMSSQFALVVSSGGKTFVIGSGFRFDDFLVTAAHVVFSPAVHDNVLVQFRGVFYPVHDWVLLAADLAYAKCPHIPGLTSCKLTTAPNSSHVQVLSAMPTENASLGLLKHVPETGFGMVEFNGSTRAGFSGGVYTNGQAVVGMHLGAAPNANFGYSASWMKMMLQHVKRNESSELYMMTQALIGASPQDIDISPSHDPAFNQVRVGAYYDLMTHLDTDEFRKNATEHFANLNGRGGQKVPTRKRLTGRKSGRVHAKYYHEAALPPVPVQTTSVGCQTDPDWMDGPESETGSYESEEDFRKVPHRDSSFVGCSPLIGYPSEDIMSTPTIVTFLKEITSGLHAMEHRLNDRLESTLQDVLTRCDATDAQAQRNISSLSESLSRLIISHSPAPLYQEMMAMKSTLISCSERLTSMARPVLESSPPAQVCPATPQLARPSVGTGLNSPTNRTLKDCAPASSTALRVSSPPPAPAPAKTRSKQKPSRVKDTAQMASLMESLQTQLSSLLKMSPTLPPK